MSKDNKKVYQKLSKKKKELELEIGKLRRRKQEADEFIKKQKRERMEAGLKILVDKIKSTKDLDPINFQKFLKNYKTELNHDLLNPYNQDYRLFSTYYFLLETIYCCSSDDIAAYLEIKPKLVDQLKKSLWEWCNYSEKNLLKLHDKNAFGFFNQKVAQFQFEVHKLLKETSEDGFYRTEKLEKVKFENLEIDLKEELIGYSKLVIGDQVSWWRRFSLKKLTELYEISPEEAVEYKIHFIAYGISSEYHNKDFTIEEGGESPYPDYEKICKYIRKEIIKEFKPLKKDYLDKLNYIAIENCSLGYSNYARQINQPFNDKPADYHEFLNENSNFIRKKYNINKNDYAEIKNNIIRSMVEGKEVQKSGFYRAVENIDKEKEILRSKAVGIVYAEKTKLEAEKTELQKEIELRKSLEKRMKKLVAQYSHTLGNTLFPETIYNVAEVLKNHADFRNDSLILKKAYHAEVLVKHQAEMLRIKHGSDTGEEFQRLILKDRLQVDSKEDAVNIMVILGYAAERVVGRLLNQDYLKIKDVRAKLVKKSGMDIDELRNDFENKVFFDQKQTSLNWINDNLAKLQIGKMSSTWGNILIRKDSYTHALLQGHWGEILFNAFKYANHTKKDFLTIKFEEHVEKDYTWLQMVWENPCKKTDKNHGGEGLEGIKEDLMQLNKTEDEKFSLYSNIKKNNFQVNLFYRSDMLISPKEDLELLENYFD